MGGFTKDELDELNLGKNFLYPNTSIMENTARNIIPVQEYPSDIFKFTIAVLILAVFTLLILLYLRSKGMKLSNLFKSLKTKIHFPKQNISSKTMIMPR